MDARRETSPRRAGRWRALLVLGALLLVAGAPVSTAAQSSSSPDQVVSVILAQGIRPTSLFGSNLLTPVGATTSFVATDLPYAIVRVKDPSPDVSVTFDLTGPAGPAYRVQAAMPPHRGRPQDFDFAAPLYILGTDFEQQTGTWHLRVSVGAASSREVTFQWLPASPASLGPLRTAVDADPLNADLHWRYGAALALLGHVPEGVQELQAAIRLEARYALYHITLGRVYERDGRRGDAVREFEAALSLHGSYYDAVFSAWARAHLTRLKA